MKGAVKPEMDQIKKLVSGRLNAQSAGQHPDPDVLAAFAENSLPGADRARLFEHLGNCSICRDVLYLAMPEAVGVQAILPLPLRSKQPRLALRWGTVAASVVILASVFVINRRSFIGHPESHSAVTPARAPLAKIAQQNTRSDLDQLAQTKPAREAIPKTRPEAKHMTVKPQASMEFDQSGQVHITSASPAVAPAENANDLIAAQKSAVKKDEPLVATRSSVEVQRQANALSAAPPEWSVSKEGAVQRSLDSGKTWESISVAQGVVFHAISSVGTHVWVGGDAGTLYHSTDSGQSWVRVKPAFAGEKLQSDIAHIDFSDALNGHVTTSTGEVWSTSDGGQSWRLK